VSPQPGFWAADLAARARQIRWLILDVDGVLTDGRLHYSSAGDESKAFHIQDGLGIKLLQASGVRVAVITGRRSPAVERRVQELGIEWLAQGAEDKLATFERLLSEVGTDPGQVACVGRTCRCCAAARSAPPCPTRLSCCAGMRTTSPRDAAARARCARCASC
jgi:3-deoxy-D-manno-octulosonate 8-phosphate phosphatase (KDO 8-P phosphatase)